LTKKLVELSYESFTSCKFELRLSGDRVLCPSLSFVPFPLLLDAASRPRLQSPIELWGFCKTCFAKALFEDSSSADLWKQALRLFLQWHCIFSRILRSSKDALPREFHNSLSLYHISSLVECDARRFLKVWSLSCDQSPHSKLDS